MERIKPKKTLTEETYEILVDAICSGDLPPGERLTQDEIASRLNVSRQPVNSAISMLRTNGLVVDTGRRGVTVANIDPALFRSIFEFRLVIEPFAVRMAIKRFDDEQRAEARKLLQAGEAAVSSGDVRTLVEADMQFHRALYRWSGNDVIQSSMQVNWHHIRRTMTAVLRNPSLPRNSWNDHAAIVDALCQADGERAASIMERHIAKAYEKFSTELSDGAREAGHQSRSHSG